jgi:acetyl-CoA carboxylase biotin carboxyl carrier protein
MNLKELKELIELVQNSGVSELELERGGVKVRIRKDGGSAPVPAAPSGPASVAPALAERATAPARPQPAASEAAPMEAEGGMTVKSPIVGTFYRAPSPDAEPYVEAGAVVKKGQVLCVIEAMKLMNEIESEHDGKVVRILAENAQPVEFGEPLFVIEPTA